MEDLSVAETKCALLCQGIDFDPRVFRECDDYYENQYVYNNTNPRLTYEDRIPQVLCLDDDTIVAIHQRRGSPWSLQGRGSGAFALLHAGRFVCHATVPERPAYFGKRLKDGRLVEQVVAVAGSRIPGFYVQPFCSYIAKGDPCQFCAVNNTRLTVGAHLARRFTRDVIIESMRIVKETPWLDIPILSITSGAYSNNDRGIREQAAVVRAINEVFQFAVPIHLLTIPPTTFEVMYELREAGVTTIAFNLEVFDRERFRVLCPGKERDHGYEGYLHALEFGRRVFGDYKVFCGFIWGLESVESTLKGYDFFLNRGINISSNVFHADAGTALEHHKHPSIEHVTALAEEQASRTEQFGIRSIFPVSMRNTLDYEIVRGDLSSERVEEPPRGAAPL